ncbi:ATP-binding protein [Pleionea sp. CnH1-48]|uniref:ATP-binding protein n=1 Tax=Pleionea sp. CnH1-48 TaxID=2954494 RepID=UPI0020980582|nr:ATP-binding protein [Pleionea sp. CnH1-48]MCO7226551.1 ATP-binding protein [Pleionea sp. CnH1-48]
MTARVFHTEHPVSNHNADDVFRCLERDLVWLSSIIEARLQDYFQKTECEFSLDSLVAPDIEHPLSPYSLFLQEYGLSVEERLVLLLALAPHIKPQLLDSFFIRNKNLDRHFTEFGGWNGKHHQGFLPTCETALFVLSGDDLTKRMAAMSMFRQSPILEHILLIEHSDAGEPFASAKLMLKPEYLELLTTGEKNKLDYNVHFPAKRIESKLSWSDLVLPPSVMNEIEQINTWIDKQSIIMSDWKLDRNIKPGYRALFYGPPGTGKTLTATLIGAKAKADVYRIDISSLVSKYIGETEKNLENVFSQAEDKHWILFFDEADALFGKRTQTSSSNDRHANQETAYLLQRIEDFRGVVILATNLKANMDDAFARRFQSMVYFPIPDAQLRLTLWKNALGQHCQLEDDIDLIDLAERYELSGGAITNVIRHAAILALRSERQALSQRDLFLGVTKELRKEGKNI